MNFIKKLQNQPEYVRKIILWAILIIMGVGLAVWWFFSFSQKIKEFKQEEFIEQLNLPAFEEELEGLPKREIPESLKEKLEKMEEEVKEMEEEGGEESKTQNPNVK